MICEICGHTNSKFVDYPQKKIHRTLKLDGIDVCSNCLFGRAIPFYSQNVLNQFYEEGSYWNGSNERSLEFYHLSQCIYRVSRITPFLSLGPKNILDIGAGSGKMYDALAKILRDFNYYFIEPDPLRNELLTKRNNSFKAKDDAKYDLIFLNHVLEHIAKPQEFLENLKSQLRPGGFAYIEVPNQDYKFKTDVFPHTLFFSEQSLMLILKKVGFEVRSISTFGESEECTIKNKLLSKLSIFSAKINNFKLSHFFNNQRFKFSDQKSTGIWINAVAQLVK